METQKGLKDTDGFDWLESTELAIDKRKFLLNRLFVKQPKRCPFCPFVLNGLVLSLLTLKSPFCLVIWPFCPVLCPFCPSHKRLKFAGTVYFC